MTSAKPQIAGVFPRDDTQLTPANDMLSVYSLIQRNDAVLPRHLAAGSSKGRDSRDCENGESCQERTFTIYLEYR
jgi:hypothetical protein